MPRYSYKCVKCDKILETIHAVGKKPKNCSEIVSCPDNSEIKKIFNVPSIFKHHGVEKTGDVVKKFIEDSKRELEEQKREMNKEKLGRDDGE